MREIDLINANTDLGVNVEGACLGADILTKNISFKNVHNIYKLYADEENKEKEKENKKKNLKKLNEFNEELYNCVLKVIDDNKFPITIGGDHSLVIASSLASIKKYESLGIIWIDAHGDYNTFDTTITGNIHGLPLAVIDGYEKEILAKFHSGNFYKPENTVIVGASDMDELEIENLNRAGVKVFLLDEVHKKGMNAVMDEAIKIALKNTKGVHISYDLDVIDKKIAPGVSVPAKNGITLEEAYCALDKIIEYKSFIKSLDLVEFNPTRDIDNKTENIAKKILYSLIKKL